MTLTTLGRRVVLSAVVVVLLAAAQFARTAEGVAGLTGVGSTFVGTWLVAVATSLPELVTSLRAVRLRVRSRRGQPVRQQRGEHGALRRASPDRHTP